MNEKTKRFPFLECLWVTHALLAAALYVVNTATLHPTAAALFPWLLLPVGWLLDWWSWVGLIPEWALHTIVATTVFLNGGFWYVILRLCFRRKPPLEAGGRGERETLRDIVRGTPRLVRWAVLPPVLFGVGLYIYCCVELPGPQPVARVRELRAMALAGRAAMAVPELLAIASGKPGQGAVRPQAVSALGDIARKSPEAHHARFVPALVAMLEDAEPGVRREAAIALGVFGGRAESAIPALLHRLEADKATEIEFFTAQTLGLIGRQPERVVPALIERVPGWLPGGRTPPSWQRGKVLAALGRFGPAARPAVPALELALEDFDSQYALMAALELARIDPANRRLEQMLVEFSHEADAGERYRILYAIGVIPADVRSPALRALVIAALTDADREVRQLAAKIGGQ